MVWFGEVTLYVGEDVSSDKVRLHFLPDCYLEGRRVDSGAVGILANGDVVGEPGRPLVGS